MCGRDLAMPKKENTAASAGPTLRFTRLLRGRGTGMEVARARTSAVCALPNTLPPSTKALAPSPTGPGSDVVDLKVSPSQLVADAAL